MFAGRLPSGCLRFSRSSLRWRVVGAELWEMVYQLLAVPALLLADKELLPILALLCQHEHSVRICCRPCVTGVAAEPRWGAAALAAGLGHRRELFRKRANFVRELFDGDRQLRVGGRERGDGASLVLVRGFLTPQRPWRARRTTLPSSPLSRGGPGLLWLRDP